MGIVMHYRHKQRAKKAFRRSKLERKRQKAWRERFVYAAMNLIWDKSKKVLHDYFQKEYDRRTAN